MMTDPDIEVIDPNTLSDNPVDFEQCEEDDAGQPSSVRALGFTATGHVYATWLVAAFKKWGVRYALVDGWEDRGRPSSSGAFNPKYGLLIHHTGSKSSGSNPAPALGLLVRGHSTLPGPLCQVTTGYDGITRIVAAGRANHAGSARAAMGNPAGDGNAMYIGNEVDTNGTQDMPDVQYDALVLSSAAILDAQGYSDADTLGLHNTTSLSGKWDLGAGTGSFGVPYSITRLRADVNARLKAGPPVGSTLDLGDRGAAVATLQTMLNKAGANLIVDGSFGPATESAVKAFQSRAKLPITGIVDANTMTALKATIIPPAPTPIPVQHKESAMSTFHFIQSDDPKVSAPVIMSDGFRMRWLYGNGWSRIRASLKQQSGTEPIAWGALDLDGIALEWVGPLPFPEYPIPANVRVIPTATPTEGDSQ